MIINFHLLLMCFTIGRTFVHENCGKYKLKWMLFENSIHQILMSHVAFYLNRFCYANH